VAVLLIVQWQIGWEQLSDSLGLGVSRPLARHPAQGAVQVHFIDVGQGSATLIVSQDSAVLIDTGDRKYQEKVVDYIRRAGVERLCMIIASHPHADHIGGIDTVIAEIGADRLMRPLIDEQYLPATATYRRKLEAVDTDDIVAFYAEVGYVFNMSESGCTYIEVLAPAGCFGDSINNHSVVVRLIHGDNSFLFTGDVERAGENCLLERNVDISADVLSIAHHGSRTSSQRTFLEAVMSDFGDNELTYAVISVGSPNIHGHPTDDVLNRLDLLGFHVLRTDLNGTIVFESSAAGLEVVSERGG
jgi:competence protein ComEC